MKQITAAEFHKTVNLDPAWASKLTEPVEVTDYCDMVGSIISHLSPLLHFTGQNEDGDAACFWNCANLKVAEGTFHGAVDFKNSGIERIDPEKLVITQADNKKNAANFYLCKNLKVAEGTFRGHVTFEKSGIERIDPNKLIITQPNDGGLAADFHSCENLKVAEGTFPGFVHFSRSGIEKVGNLHITRPDEDGEYLRIGNTPIENDAMGMQSLVNNVFGNKTIAELKEIQPHMETENPALKQAIGQQIAERKTTMERKNRAVEIQID